MSLPIRYCQCCDNRGECALLGYCYHRDAILREREEREIAADSEYDKRRDDARTEGSTAP